jgi:hypothetical protein
MISEQMPLSFPIYDAKAIGVEEHGQGLARSVLQFMYHGSFRRHSLGI